MKRKSYFINLLLKIKFLEEMVDMGLIIKFLGLQKPLQTIFSELKVGDQKSSKAKRKFTSVGLKLLVC